MVPMEVDDDDGVVVGEEVAELKATLDAKLRELLVNVNSPEIKLCSAATKEFIKLLKRNSGGELLSLYVRTTSNFSELFGAWKLQQGKPAMRYVLSLITAILNHPDGKYKPNDKERIAVSQVLDKFARSIVGENLEVIYNEVSSKDWKHQNAALLLLGSIVRRGSGLASEVAKSFNFKLPAFLKLAQYRHRKREEKRTKNTTRKAFVAFAMSFLEEGKPVLLRWVLQQKEMYSGVLRGLGNDDDDETVIYVLSTLRDRVLSEHSLVPPSLRSVLFGSGTLKQLVDISGRESGGLASELAHNVLVMVCTDPCNGLMPDLKRHLNPLRGNPKRLLDLMKKLRATEIGFHRDLLLAIVQGRFSFGSAYMEEFPYNLEDYSSPTWFSTVCLAANIVSSVGASHPFDFLDSQSDDPPSFDSADVQNIMNCISPRLFNRSIINKGLLNSDFLVKNGTLRLLLETLKLLDSFFKAIDISGSRKNTERWASLKQEIQNEIRPSLPDPQVLLTLVSSFSSSVRADESHLKRKSYQGNFLEQCSKRKKKLKTNVKNEDADIIVAGISSTSDTNLAGGNKNVLGVETPDMLDSVKDFVNAMSELWGSDQRSVPITTLKDGEIFFYSKLLDTVKIYMLAIPNALEGSFEFFMNLLGNPAALPTNLQSSLLSLLVEYIRWSPRSKITVRTPPLMYKHLQPFINLLIFSPTEEIKDKAYNLARAAMLSTGAFDRNLHEIDAWFSFLPGYSTGKSSVEIHCTEVLRNLSPVVISFLCDAISTVGNNLFKYWDVLRNHASQYKDMSPEVSPLMICVLQKCERLLNSASRAYSLPEKSTISLYVCHTLKYLLQTQVDAGFLSALIRSLLSEGLLRQCSLLDDSADLCCEWRPFRKLLLFAERTSCQQACFFSAINQKADVPTDSNFIRTLCEIEKATESENSGKVSEITKAFSSAVICASSDEVLSNFPMFLSISQHLQVPVSVLLSIIFLDHGFIAGIFKLWPEMFHASLEMASSMAISEGVKGDAFAEDMVHSVVLQDDQSVAAAVFSLFLREAPFHVIFPAFMNIDAHHLSETSKIRDLLLQKLPEWRIDHVILYLRVLLFWFYQIKSSYRVTPSAELEQTAELCYDILKHMFNELLMLKHNSEYVIREMAQTVLSHPAVITSLTCPLSCYKDYTKLNQGDSLEALISFSGDIIHKLDHHVLDLLTMSLNALSSSSELQSIMAAEDGANKHLVNAFNTLMRQLYMQLREKCDMCIKTEVILPILPYFYAIHILVQFISPFELLELVHWIFSKVNVIGLTGEQSCQMSVLFGGFSVAADAFKTLSTYLQQPLMNGPFRISWQVQEKNFDDSLIEKIYVQVCKFATYSKMDIACSCLLKVVDTVYRQKYIQRDVHPLCMVLLRVIVSSPIEIVSHCIFQTNKTKTKLLSLIVEMSPQHLLVFGHILAGILKDDTHGRGKMVEETCGSVPSDDEFMMLLPATLLYLESNLVELDKQYEKRFISIATFYSKMLLNGFQFWKSFVSRDVFQENFDAIVPSSVEDLLIHVDGSLLGKSIHLLRKNLALGGDMQTEEKLKIFDSVFTCPAPDDGLLDCNASELEFYSLNQSMNFTNSVVAKILFSQWLLFRKANQILFLPKDVDGDLNQSSVEMMSSKEVQCTMKFIKMLADSWKFMVKKFPLISMNSAEEKSSDHLQLWRFLELFILRIILELATEIQGALIQLQSIPFLEQIMRFCFLYRFEDPMTLRILRSILVVLKEGKFSCVLYLQLLVAHSQFAPTICRVPESFSSQNGALFRPTSSILRSLGFSRSEINHDKQSNEQYLKQLEVIKLLRVLLQLMHHETVHHAGKDIGINLKELHLLLLSSYGASLSEIDVEIYSIIQEIESVDKSVSENFAKTAYLWGSAALKVTKEWGITQEFHSDFMMNAEAGKEFQRSQFRENLPVDSNMCVNTVLHFPFDRTASDGSSSLNGVEQDSLKDMQKRFASEVENARRYNPVFILRFSIHALSMCYLEPMEFASLGLLAVAFVSMSSPDFAMRKLGYEFLGRYKNSLEKSQKKTEKMRIRLLLTYLQNGIEEPWQKIPSIMGLFAAESSFIFLDPSHDRYAAISKHLMHSSKANMKCVPLFHSLFKSSSVNLRTERQWILRLACAGLNLDDDAQIFIRTSIIETLLGFYNSPLSDNEGKELIHQIMMKSVKSRKMASYLVEHCGLFPWLSSILSMSGGMTNEDSKNFVSQRLRMVIEVVTEVVSIRNIAEWLQNHALEQLIDLTCHLYKLLVGGLKLKDNFVLTNSLLEIIMQTLKISQKRKLYQPHFTLSFEGLFLIHNAVNAWSTGTAIANAEIGLKVILMSTPPVDIFSMDQEKLSCFLMWAVSTALKSDYGKTFYHKDSHSALAIISEDMYREELLISKLLRWLVASVILGKLSQKCHFKTKSPKESSSKTLQSFLEFVGKDCGESNNTRSDGEEILTSTILCLQHLSGANLTLFPSVVSALCLLVFCSASKNCDFMLDYTSAATSMYTKIRFPTEANSAWRWSFYQPWKDLSTELSDLKRMDELHACQTLMVIVSNIIGKKPVESQVLSYQDIEKSGVFEWHRSLVETEQ